MEMTIDAASGIDADHTTDANHTIDSAPLIDAGIADAAPPPPDAAPPPTPAFTQMSAGTQHTCGIDSNDKLYCWGDNQYGQLGFVEIDNIPEPVNFGLPISRPQLLTIGAGSPAVTQVSAGVTHTCAITKPDDNQNTLFCWGDNSNHVISFMGMPAPLPPTAIPADDDGNAIDWSMVAAGNEFTCAIGSAAGANAQVYCWGANDSGQTGTGTMTSVVALPTPLIFPNDSTPPVQVVAGNGHACALFKDNALFCWGSNQSQQAVANGSGGSLLSPTQVKDFTGGELDFSFVAAGFDTTCAIRGANNVIDCWGSNVNAGELGNYQGGPGGSNLQEVSISGGAAFTGWSAIDVGRESACGIRLNNSGSNEIRCWGQDFNGSLGSATPLIPVPANPVVVPSLPFTPTQITMGDFFGCAYDGTHGEFCWGDNHRGQTGQPIAQTTPAPVSIFPAAGALFFPINLTAGSDHTCALTKSGSMGETVSCWGLNDVGQVTESAATNGLDDYRHFISSLATNGPNAALFSSPHLIAAGAKHTCVASNESGNEIVACFGDDSALQLPKSTQVSSRNFSAWTNPGSPITELVAGGNFTCAQDLNGVSALLSDCWGTLPDTDISDNSGIPSAVPTQVEALISDGPELPATFLGIAQSSVWGGRGTTDNTTLTPSYWGDPKLGPNFPENQQSMVPFSGESVAVVETAQGTAAHRCFADLAGDLICGGPNDDGQVPNVAPSPMMPAPLTTFSGNAARGHFHSWPDASGPHLAVGSHHTCAVSDAGFLFCFGDNTFGQLGNVDGNSSVAFPFPPNQAITQAWVAVAAGDRHTCAVLSQTPTGGGSASPTYQVYCWGAGDFGQLGSDFNGNEPSFQRLPTLLQ